MADGYRYDPDLRTYIGPSGHPISIAVIRALRDKWADIQADVMRDFVGHVADGSWTLAEFEAAARVWLGETITAGYQLGRGGAGMMSYDDVFELARLISNQARHMEQLIAKKESGLLSPAQFGARAEMAAGSAVHAFEVGQGAAADGLDLPGYPADGDTSCLLNCRCFWSIEEFEDRYEATWVTVGDGVVCPECEQRGDAWAPYVQTK